MLASWSPFGVHEAPPLVDFQMPPATPATHIRSLFLRSIRIARVRPPMLPGPSGDQPVVAVATAVCAACLLIISFLNDEKTGLVARSALAASSFDWMSIVSPSGVRDSA